MAEKSPGWPPYLGPFQSQRPMKLWVLVLIFAPFR